MRLIKLGTPVTDIASGVTGMAIMRQIEMDRSSHVIVQPSKLNEETGDPAPRIVLSEARLRGEVFEDVKYPFEVLGTEVEDTCTGFKGMATGFLVHQNGCLHVNVQPKGMNKKTGAHINSHEFFLYRLKGDAIPKMDEPAIEREIAQRPSPSGDSALFETSFNALTQPTETHPAP
jgi:hypothetical protein